MIDIYENLKYSYKEFIEKESLYYLIIFYMVIFQGHKYKYVAKIFDISNEAVRQIVKKMSKKLYKYSEGINDSDKKKRKTIINKI